MGLSLAAIDGGIPQRSVVTRHVYLDTNTALQSSFTPLLHLLPQVHVDVDS